MVTTHFMDEAEHCDSIGFIYEGKLIADDTPDRLKQGLPGLLLEIPADNPMELFESITSRGFGCLDIYPYGTTVHVLAQPEQLADYAQYSYNVISPSLEDVFVYYVKSQRKELVL